MATFTDFPDFAEPHKVAIQDGNIDTILIFFWVNQHISMFTDVPDLLKAKEMDIRDHTEATMVYYLKAHHCKLFEKNPSSLAQLSRNSHFCGCSGFPRNYKVTLAAIGFPTISQY